MTIQTPDSTAARRVIKRAMDYTVVHELCENFAEACLAEAAKDPNSAHALDRAMAKKLKDLREQADLQISKKPVTHLTAVRVRD